MKPKSKEMENKIIIIIMIIIIIVIIITKCEVVEALPTDLK